MLDVFKEELLGTNAREVSTVTERRGHPHRGEVFIPLSSPEHQRPDQPGSGPLIVPRRPNASLLS